MALSLRSLFASVAGQQEIAEAVGISQPRAKTFALDCLAFKQLLEIILDRELDRTDNHGLQPREDAYIKRK